MRIDIPGNGSLAAFGEPVPFKVTVTDPEETIDCSKVKVAYSLGHDSHAHELTSETGCEGTLKPPACGDGGHDPNANIYGVVGASYTDGGANGQEALTGTARTVLQPLHRQAEHFTAQSGVNTFDKAEANGGKTVGDINDGDWISFSPYRFDGQKKMTVRASSGGSGGFIELRTGSPRARCTARRTSRRPAAGRRSRTSTSRCGHCRRRPPRSTWSSGAARARCTTWTTSSSPRSRSRRARRSWSSRTAGFRHDSIPEGVKALKELGAPVKHLGHRDRGGRTVHHRQPRQVRRGRLPVHHR